MGSADLRKRKNLRRCRLIGTGRYPSENRLERNFREWKFWSSCHERAREDTEEGATGDLKHRLELEWSAPAQETHDACMTAATEHGQRTQHRCVSNNIQNGVDALRIRATNELMQRCGLEPDLVCPKNLKQRGTRQLAGSCDYARTDVHRDVNRGKPKS